MSKKRAIISLTDKSGIVEFAKILIEKGYEIISTGGTQRHLENGGIKTVNVSDVTKFPECLDGRVKTLHPAVHAGILAVRDNDGHMQTLTELEIGTIDMVIINLYPFKETILRLPSASFDEAVENIDIGGPTMLRAAAKNWKYVTVITDPSDYAVISAEMSEGEIKESTRLRLAKKVFEHTAAYDALVAEYLRKETSDEKFPEKLTLTYELAQPMRYGENPHQNGVFYREVTNTAGTLVEAVQLHGKELSYNNINDANGALDVLKEFEGNKAAVVAVKHANPCGVGVGDTAFEAYMRAYEADPVSIFGGIVACNREVGKKIANEIMRAKTFLEVIIAPNYTDDALKILMKKKNLRLLKLRNITKSNAGRLNMKKVAGGLLVQEQNAELIKPEEIRYVTKRRPTENEMKDLIFAYKVVKHTSSNAIVLAKNDATVGIGPGQTNRITALELAIKYAGDKTTGAVMASDAFFPFGDCVEAAHTAGITAIIQPGGSVRDDESIELCDKYGIAMIFTGIRHFKH